MRRAAIATLLMTASCGAPRGPAPSVPLPAATKHYAPLEMKADAKRASQAVLLGTSAHDDATVLALPAVPHPVRIAVPFVGRPNGLPARGGSLIATLIAQPNGYASALAIRGADGDARWAAALWSASLVAASALGKDLPDLAVTAQLTGTVDGLDGSALVAAALLASLTGESLDPAAALAGTIDPDGTIGPVDGVPEQLLEAVGRGAKSFGYPAGMRMARSAATGKDVDLVQLAGEHHAQAVELATVHDAYQLLTHRQLPATLPVGEDDMTLDREMSARLDGQYAAAQQRLAGQWPQMLQLEQAGRLPGALALMVQLARDRSQRAEVLHRAGKLAAAYSQGVIAWVYAASANATSGVLAKLAAGDVAGAASAFAAVDTAGEALSALRTKLAAMRPATLTGELALFAAEQALLRGQAFHGEALDAAAEANRLLAALRDRPGPELSGPDAAQRVAAALAPSVLLTYRTLAELAVADEELALEQDQGVAYTCSGDAISRLASGFEAASTAAMHYVDARLVEPLVQDSRGELGAAAVRRQVAASDPDYLVASALAQLPPPAAADDNCSIQSLAIHELVYREAVRLIARYDTLDVHTDNVGRADGVAVPAAFKSLLARARLTARSAARAARIAAGAIPVEAVLAYQLAEVEEAGSLDDQLSALAELWTSTALSQAAAMLARN